MTEQEKIRAIIDEELKKVNGMTPEEFEKYVKNSEPYDPIWDDIFNIARELGYGYESHNSK